jgi:hypothetical protein
VATASFVVQSRVKPSPLTSFTTASASIVAVLLFTFTKARLVLSIPWTLVVPTASRSARAELPWLKVKSPAPRPRRLWATGLACVTSWTLARRTASGEKRTPLTAWPFARKVAMWQTQFGGEKDRLAVKVCAATLVTFLSPAKLLL